jgi:DNA-binding NtrC family response regulator
VIAATSRDLEAEVSAARFDEDLFRRLHVVVITVPPLRCRAADLSVLFDRIVAAAAHARGVRALVLDRDAERLLFAHDWKGNIGELVEVARRLVSSGNRHIGIDAVRSALHPGASIPARGPNRSERRP